MMTAVSLSPASITQICTVPETIPREYPSTSTSLFLPEELDDSPEFEQPSFFIFSRALATNAFRKASFFADGSGIRKTIVRCTQPGPSLCVIVPGTSLKGGSPRSWKICSTSFPQFSLLTKNGVGLSCSDRYSTVAHPITAPAANIKSSSSRNENRHRDRPRSFVRTMSEAAISAAIASLPDRSRGLRPNAMLMNEDIQARALLRHSQPN